MTAVGRLLPLLVAGCVILTGSSAFAHPHHAPHVHGNGFESGLFHPLLGIDHLLAMVAVGVLAARIGGRGIWSIPLAFLGCMILGGVFGGKGWELIGVESGIALSLILLGSGIAAGRDQPFALVLGACGLFGFYHGHAHGVEMPSMAEPLLYALGFVLATALLHLAGIAVGKFLERTAARRIVLRLSGAAVALAGVVLLLK